MFFLGESIGESLSKTFKSRFREILDSCQNSADSDSLKVTNKMDMLERMLYKEGQKTKQGWDCTKTRIMNIMYLGMDAWKKRKTGLINTASMVAMHRKRKANFD